MRGVTMWGRGLPVAMRGAARAARLMVMAATGAGTGTGHKRPHPEPAPRIGTHDGTFHCDEALACFLLRLLPRYRDAEIVRTRDPQRLAGCDVVVDVGGEYDPGRHRYDHHQRSFTESMRSLRPDKPWSTKLSSAGLVYCHFGAQILAGLLGQPEDGPVVSALYDKLYENFVEEIDAMDNGIAPAAGEPRYALSTTLSARVGHLNPRWNDPDQDTEAGFRRAMELVGTEFLQRLDFYHRAWLPARALVEEAVRRRLEVDASGQVLELSQGGCPWKEHLFQLEREQALPRPLLLVLFPDRGGQWRVQSVPTAAHSFQSRLPLPEAWRGLRDEALSELAGIPGCIFVHASGFIGGNRTREGALEMARRALELGGGTESTAMRAAGLLLLLLGLPQQPRAGSRCPGGAPPVPLAPSGHNETLGRAAGTARAPDVAALVALGGWLGLVLLCVRRFVRRSREETRLHLRALPCGAHRERREEEEPLSGGTGSQPGGPGG